MQPSFQIFDAEELVERLSEDECWWEDGWIGAPNAGEDAVARELENALADVVRQWAIKHGTLDGAQLDFIEGPVEIKPGPEA